MPYTITFDGDLLSTLTRAHYYGDQPTRPDIDAISDDMVTRFIMTWCADALGNAEEHYRPLIEVGGNITAWIDLGQNHANVRVTRRPEPGQEANNAD